ncbi:MAG: hypothetical protein FJ056_04060 [Cyanobacteria bacterium M_surface_10_m2_179]|nr:hypothetical protein [Cyanobacteria bacterium M_surface_10_m2_179]
MTAHWVKLRWPITLVALGGMALTAVVRLGDRPIQVKLMHSFAAPLVLSGQVNGNLTMAKPVQIQPMAVRVMEHAPMDLNVANTTPVQVQVSNPNPIQIKMDEAKTMQVDVNPQAPAKVKLGL